MSAKKSRPWQGAAGATSDDDNTILAAAADKSRPAGAAAAHPPHSLLEQHERLLEKSGIPLQFAREHGIRSASAAEDLPQNLRWAAAHENALPGLLITWRTVDGGVNYQLRPDKPPVIKGEPRKYLQPNNVRLLNVLGDPAQSDMLFLVEGSKQGYAAAAHAPKGVLVVAIPGCRGWSHERKLLPELARPVPGTAGRLLLGCRRRVERQCADRGHGPDQGVEGRRCFRCSLRAQPRAGHGRSRRCFGSTAAEEAAEACQEDDP